MHCHIVSPAPSPRLFWERIQIELSRKVRICPLRKIPSYIAGVDAAFDGESVTAVASLFAHPSLIHKADAVSREPVFVSPGHLIELRSSIEIALQCLTQYRLPEPISRADHLSKDLVRKKSRS